MDATGGKNCSDLKLELTNARDTLLVLNDSIRRIIGRPKHTKDRSEKKSSYDVDSLKYKYADSSTNKRGVGPKSVFKRLSSPTKPADETKPPRRLTSRVIRELPSRQDIVNAQCADSESRARNRRMFGSLLGTLHKFCQEESRLKQKEEKKAQIEKKLEQQEIIERESLKKERQSLFLYRKRKQMEIKSLERKISRVQDFEVWEASANNMKTFIKTKTKPSIYFKPKILSSQTEKLLAESETALSKSISEKKSSLNQELREMEEDLDAADISMEDNVEKDDSLSDIPNASERNNMNYSNEKEEKDSLLKENKLRGISEPTLNSVVVNIDGCNEFR
ncbi:desmosome associated protein-like protein pinnin [Haematobia irritans]|uniref:desmosome associated protein-like protein pinnin n=1 Tax=Haematobia irritans TaxID=7368 RepID=UPI003F4FF957